jgi:hypothetical protein
MEPHPLLAEIDRFIADHTITESQFGVRAVNDWKFVASLREGRDLLGRTERKVRDFMADYDPAAWNAPGRPPRDAEAAPADTAAAA